MAAEIELLKCCYVIHYFLKSTLDPEHKSLKVTQVFERNILQAINVGRSENDNMIFKVTLAKRPIAQT